MLSQIHLPVVFTLFKSLSVIYFDCFCYFKPLLQRITQEHHSYHIISAYYEELFISSSQIAIIDLLLGNLIYQEVNISSHLSLISQVWS